MSRPAQVVLSLLVVFHVVASVGSVVVDTPVGRAIRTVTRPWEKALGVHQTWPMFGSPPRATVTLRFVAVTADGAEREVAVLPGEPDPDSVVWFYDRGAKLERNAAEDKRDSLRESLVRYVCRHDPTAARVRIERVVRRSPVPLQLPVADRAAWPVHTVPLDDVECR